MLLREIYEKLMKPIPEAELPVNTRQGMEFICKNVKMALLGPALSGQTEADHRLIQHGCKIITLDRILSTADSAIAFGKHSPYRDAINSELVYLHFLIFFLFQL